MIARVLLALLGLAALGACSTPTDTPCQAGDTRLISGYSGAPDHACERIDTASFAIEVAPEAEPINPSPWYAFTLTGTPGSDIDVTLRYTAAQHRYAPWVRDGDGPWRLLAHSQLSLDDTQTQASLALTLAGPSLQVAAQPLYNLEDYAALETRWPGDWQTFGQSVSGRPLRALLLAPVGSNADAEPARWILLLGRQHPPEIPGVWAFDAFTDVMVERYHAGTLNAGLIVMPLLNPDGVEAGHWRLNANGVDLNRDWADRSQPETTAVMAFLRTQGIAPGELDLVVDFHATVGERLYLPQSEELSEANAARLDRWLAAMEAKGLFEITDPRRTRPARRISAKSVFTDEWDALALTWEAGDTTPEATVRALAAEAAELWR